jgi:hypothetical protein
MYLRLVLFFGLLPILFVTASVRSQAFGDPVPSELERIRVSDDGTHFVGSKSGKRFIVWGVNYDHNEGGQLLEDYWIEHWDDVVSDFREIKQLGCNVVRIHLQLPKTMKTATEADEENLQQIARLVKLAEQTGLYLDLTGLGCYHKQDVPAWYDELSEQDRWDVQARFWTAVAKTCKDSPAIFCYDLMNEPIIGGANPESGWLTGELGGKHFVQRITLDAKGRTRPEIAKAWVAHLTAAIRKVDPDHMITVGVIPWAHTFPKAKPLFHDPEVGKPLDFVAVHFYPRKGEVDAALKALKVYDVGKPLVIEEIFPLKSSLEETDQFIQESKSYTDGWISFYWGKTIAENEAAGDIRGAIIAAWLKYFSKEAKRKD